MILKLIILNGTILTQSIIIVIVEKVYLKNIYKEIDEVDDEILKIKKLI